MDIRNGGLRYPNKMLRLCEFTKLDFDDIKYIIRKNIINTSITITSETLYLFRYSKKQHIRGWSEILGNTGTH